jgi:dUTP pyrophosphatase
MEHLKIRIARVGRHSRGIALPSYATPGSAGMDVCAAVENDVEIQPGQCVLIPTGFSIELPLGYEAQVRPRSGLAINHGIGILNAPGTIDSDYRGEVKIILSNFGNSAFVVRRGDRVAQIVIHKFERADWVEVPELSQTDRGGGGFGHTGSNSERASHG